VTDFHSAAAAAAAADAFEARFTRGELALEELPSVSVSVPPGGLSLAKVLVAAALASSVSEATRKIQQGGVRVDREKVTQIQARVAPGQAPFVLEVGRRAIRVAPEASSGEH
jgi:tyrosyl-tRNA synthetase